MIIDIREDWFDKKSGIRDYCKIGTRICDNCQKKENVRYIVLINNRKKRASEKDYCYICSQKLRKMPVDHNKCKWKHGKTYNGYPRITIDKKRVLEHVWVMENHLGRKLQKKECVHHLDMNKENNDLSNLFLFKNQSDHQKCHISMEKCGFDLFNEKIWFDFSLKQYALLRSTNHVLNEKVFDLQIKKEIGYDRGVPYWFYHIKNEAGNWQQKRYHILVAETVLGRKIHNNECVHHVNGNTLDASPSNLIVLTRIEHGKCHCSLQKCVAKLYDDGVVQFVDGSYFLPERN